MIELVASWCCLLKLVNIDLVSTHLGPVYLCAIIAPRDASGSTVSGPVAFYLAWVNSPGLQ